ncbi:MAG: Druantia anti-phage system protein DruA [Gaiellaceae bacterium]
MTTARDEITTNNESMGSHPAAASALGAGAPSALLPRRFQPQLTLGFQHDLSRLASELITLGVEERLTRLSAAIDVVETSRIELVELGLPPGRLQPTIAYSVTLRLLRDLLGQGWELAVDDEGLLLHPPLGLVTAADDPAAAKEALRESFAFARNAQLDQRATRGFVETMERRGIGRLFADGPALAARLTDALEAGELAEAIKPTLELVTPDARDPGSGLRLQDIWRYARHFWSIPYQSTPGRNLFYLVRDDALPERPVIGIAALGNPIIGLAQRDRTLGWTADSLASRLVDAPTRVHRKLARHLLAVLEEGIQSVYCADLDVDLERDDCVERLRALEQEATLARRSALAAAGEGRTADYLLIRAAHDATAKDQAGTVDWEAVARTTLYRRKRAATLSDLTRARQAFRRFDAERSTDGLVRMLDDEDGRRAIDTALRRIKQRALNENVMDIITCGAVPPYGDLLGGKLVAALLTSPRVVADFRARYSDRVSLIGSGLAGKAVSREPNLCFLTTSGLYSVGSSQYDGIRIPGDLFGNQGQIRYRRLGTTLSFGTVHFAPDTAGGLAVLGRLADNNRRLINHLFGEGMSPKLRAIREGLRALGLSGEVFLRHHSPRLLYGAALATNTDEVLLGLARRPRFVLRPPRGSDGTAEIAAHWRERWLTPRLQRPEVLERLRATPREELLLGLQLPAATTNGTNPVEAAPHGWLRSEERDSGGGGAPGGSATEFVERLYRSTNIYADRLSPEELEWVNVDLGLEDYLLEQARASRQVIVTGNPGDGKTHLIERIRGRLEDEGALVLTDANELSDEEIIVAWRTCEREARPLVLAINEWPLFVLRRHPQTHDFAPLAEALRQVQEAIYYTETQTPAGPAERVRVVDLSLRNVLARPIVDAVIDRLTHERFYTDLHEADPARTNREALQNERVRERLSLLLDRVASRGHHATMRQLVGLIAFLLTGGRNAIERLAEQRSSRFHYATLAFAGGVGPLFDAIRATFDPAYATHPRYDDDLWRGGSDRSVWLYPEAAQLGIQQLPETERGGAHAALKRRFYFEHDAGAELLALAPADEREFERLTFEGAAGAPTVVGDLILALNRFFEPDAPASDHEYLQLWQSHRFDVRPPETFVALHRLEQRAFRIEPPRFAAWVEEWLPSEQRLVASFAFVARGEHDVEVPLIVDRNLYLTLAEAERGLGRASWTRSATRRITRFVDRLHQLTEFAASVYDLRIRNTDTDLDERFEVQRQPPRYLL